MNDYLINLKMNKIRYFLILLIIGPIQMAIAQKKLIDSNAYKNWQEVTNSNTISNDGQYVSYIIENEPLG